MYVLFGAKRQQIWGAFVLCGALVALTTVVRMAEGIQVSGYLLSVHAAFLLTFLLVHLTIRRDDHPSFLYSLMEAMRESRGFSHFLRFIILVSVVSIWPLYSRVRSDDAVGHHILFMSLMLLLLPDMLLFIKQAKIWPR